MAAPEAVPSELHVLTLGRGPLHRRLFGNLLRRIYALPCEDEISPDGQETGV